MNPLEFFFFATFLIYSFFYKLPLFVIYISLLVLYSFLSQKWMKPERDLNSWAQKRQQCIWNAPSEGSAKISIELQCSASLSYAKKLSQCTGKKITITHLLVRALALGIRSCPKAQGYIKWGNFSPDKKIGTSLIVDVDKGKDIVTFLIQNPDTKSIQEIADQANQKVDIARKKMDKIHIKRTYLAKFMPTFLLNFGAAITGYIVGILKLPVRTFGFEGSDFGTQVVSNIGMFGMNKAFSPLVGAIGAGMTMIVGAIQNKAIVIDGKIQIRDVIFLNFTADHRFGDASIINNAFRQMQNYIKDPELYQTNYSK